MKEKKERMKEKERKGKDKQGRIHGYPSRVRVGRGYIGGHLITLVGAVRPKTAKPPKK